MNSGLLNCWLKYRLKSSNEPPAPAAPAAAAPAAAAPVAAPVPESALELFRLNRIPRVESRGILAAGFVFAVVVGGGGVAEAVVEEVPPAAALALGNFEVYNKQKNFA